MKNVIIFDFWGTVVEQGVYSHMKQVKRLLGLYDLDYSDFVVRFERAMMTKKFNSLSEAFAAVCVEFEIKHDERLIEELIGTWNKNWLLARPYEETMEVLKELKEKSKLILVANTDNFSVNGVLDKFKLRHYFDLVFLSCDMGFLKIDSDFYATLLKESNEEVKNCLAVGDSIHSDAEPAKNAGMDVVLIDRHNKRDFPNKIMNLRELLWN